MKIYILPVPESLQPRSAKVIYPLHNDDYSLEQDFLIYLQQNQELLTPNADQADFHYLPVFWTRWRLGYIAGKNPASEIVNNVAAAILDDSKTFTISNAPKNGLLANIGKTIFFTTARNSDDVRDLPLICKAHVLPAQIPEIKYRVSFVGRLVTHPIRETMVNCFADFSDSYICVENLNTDLYVEKIMESLLVLCPRGTNGSSFRFYEAMQLGRVPFLIGDLDTRPFKKYIPWDQCSFYATSPQEALEIVKNCRKEQLTSMGEAAAAIWRDKLNFGKWCQYILKELNDL